VGDGPDPRCEHCGAALPATPLREAVSERTPGVPPPPKPGWDRHRDDNDYDDRPGRYRPAPARGSSSSTTTIVVICLVVGGLILLPLIGFFFFFWFIFQDHPGAQGPKRAAAPVAVAAEAPAVEIPKMKMEIKDIWNQDNLFAKNPVPFKVIPPGQGEFKMPANNARAATNYLRADSAKGDSIGLGKQYFYPANQLRILRNDRGVNISVDGWDIDIGAPDGQFLQVGEYQGAKRYAFSGNSPGIDFRGQGRGSNTIAGSFVVWEIEFDGNQLTRLAIDFVQRSEEVGPPLSGSLRINSTFE
jgi:hypothetical protein